MSTTNHNNHNSIVSLPLSLLYLLLLYWGIYNTPKYNIKYNRYKKTIKKKSQQQERKVQHEKE